MRGREKCIVFDVVQPHLSRPSSSSLLLYLETTSSAVVFGDVAFRNSGLFVVGLHDNFAGLPHTLTNLSCDL